MTESTAHQALLEQLQACGNQDERERLLMRFSISQLPEPLRAAVQAAAVPRFFDRAFLNALLEQPLDEAQFAELTGLSYIEPYPGEGRFNVHERSRKLLQEKLWQEDEALYREISRRAFAYCKKQDQNNLTWRIETVYHQLVAEPDTGAIVLNDTCVAWTNPPHFAHDKEESLLLAAREHLELNRLTEQAGYYFLLRQAKVDMRYSRNRQAKAALEQIPLSAIKKTDLYLAVNCLKALGDVHLRLSELPAARQRYDEAMPLYRKIGDRLGEANCLQALGDVYMSLSEFVAEYLEGFAKLHQARNQPRWLKETDLYRQFAMPLRAEQGVEQLRHMKEQKQSADVHHEVSDKKTPPADVHHEVSDKKTPPADE